MKTLTNIRILISLLAINAGVLWGAPAAANLAGATLPAPTPYAVVSRDANSSVWERTTYELSPAGAVVPQKHRYVELATGLHYKKNGLWVESKEEIDILPNGTAAATQGQHQAHFPGNIYEGMIELVTSDGKHLQSRPLGLSYDDGTHTVLIAELTNSVGYLVGSNQVIYPDAFTDFKADLRYTYTKAGFEQDILLREQPLTPESYGLNPATARLQVLTEFFNSPQPAKTTKALPKQAGIALNDESLDFGAMKMMPGRAFLLGTDAHEGNALVGKSWVKLEGRQFLVEEVPVEALVDELAQLPEPQTASTKPDVNSTLHVVSAKRVLPAPRLTKASPGGPFKQMAQAATPTRGLVLDYLMIHGIQTNYTFQGDTTYYIVGRLCLYGTNTFEGGAVFKFSNNNYGSICLAASALSPGLNWLATAYRPVIFTAMDDNSVGEPISGSTGNPTNYYANPALEVYGFGNTIPTISYFRVAYALQAFSLCGSSANFYHGQIVNCQNGITVNGANPSHLRNVLFGNVQTDFNNLLEGNFDVQNSTFSGSSYLSTIQNQPYQSSSVILMNCLLVNITNLQSYYSYGNMGSYQVSGDHNGFYKCPTVGTGTFTNTFYPFQSVGAGNYYLASGCAFTNAGTTNIDSTLLSALRQKTTHPPSTNPPYQYNNSSRIWSPVVPRDTNTAPDLGYHYDPLDYLCSQITPQGPVLLTNGVAVGFYGSVGINGGAPLTSVGLANALNHLVWYPSVQEQPVSLNNISTAGSALFSTITPSTSMRFTDIAMLGRRQTFVSQPNWYILTLKDCQLHGVNLSAGAQIQQNSSPGASIGLQNCLLERCTASFFNGYSSLGNGPVGGPVYSITYYQNPFIVNLYNNLFWQSTVSLNYLAAQAQYVMPWRIKDNLFDNSAFSFGGDGNYMQGIYVSNNGYRQTTDALPGTNDVNPITNLVYATSWYGPWYIGSSSPTILYMGSQSAASAGLYHYTIQTNQLPDGANTVSIGYHYVATDSNGNPIDTNGDGIPDYLEDANGNGIYDAGDLGNWLISPFNGLTTANGLSVFTPLR